MKRMIMAGLTASALAFSPIAAPGAQADAGEEFLGLLLGIGLVHAIGKGIERSRSPVEEQESLTPPPTSDRLAFNSSFPAAQRSLPRDCLGTFDTWHGKLSGFGVGCLDQRMDKVEELPADCAIHTRVGQKDRTIYSARCLQFEGWTVAGSGRYQTPHWYGAGRTRP